MYGCTPPPPLPRAYTIKFAELLESHTLASALAYDNEYRKLQCEYGF